MVPISLDLACAGHLWTLTVLPAASSRVRDLAHFSPDELLSLLSWLPYSLRLFSPSLSYFLQFPNFFTSLVSSHLYSLHISHLYSLHISTLSTSLP
jgi:hypothetical protein